ncbi:MAG: hypothetical protein NWF14_08435 [Candidatus Bathyarchaeota archaeon]|nr:hypothetical protein [Candidatus Bathyarchaeota archaeon]
MRSRWLALLGRSSLVMFVVGLALALVSLTPALTGLTSSSGGTPFSGWRIRDSWVLSSQIGLRCSVQSAGTLEVYVLGVERVEMEEWITSWALERFPDLNENSIWWRMMTNVSMLDAFLQTHPEIILANQTMNGASSFDFFATKLTNVTVVVANRVPIGDEVTVTIRAITALVAGDRAAKPAGILIFFGAVLSIPWVAHKYRTLHSLP